MENLRAEWPIGSVIERSELQRGQTACVNRGGCSVHAKRRDALCVRDGLAGETSSDSAAFGKKPARSGEDRKRRTAGPRRQAAMEARGFRADDRPAGEGALRACRGVPNFGSRPSMRTK